MAASKTGRSQSGAASTRRPSSTSRQRTAVTRKSTASRGGARRSSGSTVKKSQHRQKKATSRQAGGNVVAVFVLFALLLVLCLCVFGIISGAFGPWVKGLLLGLLGGLGYVLPALGLLYLIYRVLFVSDGMALRQVIAVALVTCCLGMLLAFAHGTDFDALREMTQGRIEALYEMAGGGGVVFGTFAMWFDAVFGKIGSVLLLVILLLLSILLYGGRAWSESLLVMLSDLGERTRESYEEQRIERERSRRRRPRMYDEDDGETGEQLDLEDAAREARRQRSRDEEDRGQRIREERELAREERAAAVQEERRIREERAAAAQEERRIREERAAATQEERRIRKEEERRQRKEAQERAEDERILRASQQGTQPRSTMQISSPSLRTQGIVTNSRDDIHEITIRMTAQDAIVSASDVPATDASHEDGAMRKSPEATREIRPRSDALSGDGGEEEAADALSREIIAQTARGLAERDTNTAAQEASGMSVGSAAAMGTSDAAADGIALVGAADENATAGASDTALDDAASIGAQGTSADGSTSMGSSASAADDAASMGAQELHEMPDPITERSHAEQAPASDDGAAVEDAEADLHTPAPKAYVPPVFSLLKELPKKNSGDSDQHLKETALLLQQTLKSFGVIATVTNISQGPSVTRFELVPAEGTKVNKIVGLTDDLKLGMAAQDIRIEAPIPGKAAVGIEIPNKETNPVYIRDLLQSVEFQKAQSKISFAVGKDISGGIIVGDIGKMPHLLVAGATGSGKSVFINTLIMSILYKATPDEVKLIMVDPKFVELSVYNGIPHLLLPVVTDPKQANAALAWAVAEMTRRYRLLETNRVRSLAAYNELVDRGSAQEEGVENPKRLPQIVVIVDELADLMMVASKEVEESICRLAQLARAAGIHLVIATQRPSVNVITGLIKANMPSRIAFRVSSGIDSRTILDMVGAERLLGNGDMLYAPQNFTKPLRVQGAFVSDTEVSDVVEYLKRGAGEDVYDEDVLNKIASMTNQTEDGKGAEKPGRDEAEGAGGGSVDSMFEEVCRFVVDKQRASSTMLQRVFKISYNRAVRLIDQMEAAGVIGPEAGTKPRSVLMDMPTLEKYLAEKK